MLIASALCPSSACSWLRCSRSLWSVARSTWSTTLPLASSRWSLPSRLGCHCWFRCHFSMKNVVIEYKVELNWFFPSQIVSIGKYVAYLLAELPKCQSELWKIALDQLVGSLKFVGDQWLRDKALELRMSRRYGDLPPTLPSWISSFSRCRKTYN